MAYYQISVVLKNNTVRSAIREIAEENIDMLYGVYEMKAKKAYGSELKIFNIGRVSKYSEQVLEYLRNKEKRPHDIDGSMKPGNFRK
jgi:hypothetical protein